MREKRKPSSGQHLDAEKRRCLSWNMYDGAGDSAAAGPSSSEDVKNDHLHVDNFQGDEPLDADAHVEEGIDDIPSKSSENTAPSPISEETFESNKDGARPVHGCHMTQSQYDSIKSFRGFKFKVQMNPPLEEEHVGQLCRLDILLAPTLPGASKDQSLPQLHSTGSATLFLHDMPERDFLVFDEGDTRLQQAAVSEEDMLVAGDGFLAFAVNIEKRPSSKCLESLQTLQQQLKYTSICRHLSLSIGEYNNTTGHATLDVWLLSEAVADVSHPSQPPPRRKHFECMQHIMNWFHGMPLPSKGKYRGLKGYDYTTLFEKVQDYHRAQQRGTGATDVQHPALIPDLRPYQQDAVRWMVMKEQVEQDGSGQPHVLWRHIKTLDNRSLYYNLHTGEITSKEQVMPRVFPGGILADEMGLGKTVEVLATILAHPRKGPEPAAVSLSPGSCHGGQTADNTDACREHSSDKETTPLPAFDSAQTADNTDACREHSLDKETTQSPAFDSAQTVDNTCTHRVDQEMAPSSGHPVIKVESSKEERTTSAVFEGGQSLDNPGTNTNGYSDQEIAPSSEQPGINVELSEEERTASAVFEDGQRLDNIHVVDNRDVCLDQEITASSGNPKIKVEFAHPDDTSPGSVRSNEPSVFGSVEISSGSTEQQISLAEGDAPLSSESQMLQSSDILLPVKQEFDSSALESNGEGVLQGPINTCPALNHDVAIEKVNGQDISDDQEGIHMSEAPVFQCICGSEELDIALPTCVQCLGCRTWQHSQCVGFDRHVISHMTSMPGEQVQYWCPCCFPQVITPSPGNQGIKVEVEHSDTTTPGSILSHGSSEHGSAEISPGSTEMVPGSTGMVPGSTEMVPGSSEMIPGSAVMEPGSTEMVPGSSDMVLGCENGALASTVHTQRSLLPVKQEPESIAHEGDGGLSQGNQCAEVKTEGNEPCCEVMESPDQRNGSETLPAPGDKEVIAVRDAQVFQCICGVEEWDLSLPAFVQCLDCRTWQHMKCVGFDQQMTSGQLAQYRCPCCIPKMPPMHSGATLIITPSSICHQWVDEIDRHIVSSTLKVMVYEGVKKNYVHPKTLADYDIVITTYRTLQDELHYANLTHPGRGAERVLRYRKRYVSAPSPLLCVDWWRLCLDEAQMIESPSVKSSEMATMFCAQNRWCVTGTPIQKTLDDLYGIFFFLGVEPFWVKHWWNTLLGAPYSRGETEPMQKALCKVFWRTAKKDVLDQIMLPPQTEQIHWLDFFPVEAHFYQRKHEECSRSFTFHSNKTDLLPETKLSSLERLVLQKLLSPLLRLRQACCHPHVVRGEYSVMEKRQPITMKCLLARMVSQGEKDCVTAHRQLVMAINGLAAIHCIKNEIPEAVKMYREALQSAEEQKAIVKTDTVQLLHAMHNLSEILRDRSDVVEPQPEDFDLPQRMASLKEEYLARTEALVGSSRQTLVPLRAKVLELKRKIQPGPPWYLDGIQWVKCLQLGKDLVDRLKTDLEARADVMGLADKFHDVRGLEFVLVSELEELSRLYQAAWKGITSLSSRLQEAGLAREATDCHLRPARGRIKHSCTLCQVEDQLQNYEMKLFMFDPRTQMDTRDASGPSNDPSYHDDGQTVNPLTAGPRGTWATSDAERALRILLSYLRTCNTDDKTLEDGVVYCGMLEQQRKEFKALRAYWSAMRERVAAVDELEMGMMRLRVRLPGEETDPASQPYIVEPHEVDPEKYRFLNDRVVARSDLQRKIGQLVYLQNLSQAQSVSQEGRMERNPEPCPVCVRPLGRQWNVMMCGHCFCLDCMDIMVKRCCVGRRQGAVKCPVCRLPTEGAEVFIVSASSQQQGPVKEAEHDVHVTGDHSTKITAVVRTLKMIRLKEPGAKSIVFSTWNEVLELLSKALFENHISFRMAAMGLGPRHFQKNLREFKQKADVSTLLLPVRSGSRGLNLTQATHVLLMEPILNPASELQAIGRVHRIGQYRETVVHRFLVHHTIEEKLHSYLRAQSSTGKANPEDMDTGDMTLSDLRKLFAADVTRE